MSCPCGVRLRTSARDCDEEGPNEVRERADYGRAGQPGRLSSRSGDTAHRAGTPWQGEQGVPGRRAILFVRGRTRGRQARRFVRLYPKMMMSIRRAFANRALSSWLQVHACFSGAAGDNAGPVTFGKSGTRPGVRRRAAERRRRLGGCDIPSVRLGIESLTGRSLPKKTLRNRLGGIARHPEGWLREVQ